MVFLDLKQNCKLSNGEMRAFFWKRESNKGGENNLKKGKKRITDRPPIDYYQKYLEISFSIAREKDIFRLDKINNNYNNNNNTANFNEKSKQSLRYRPSTAGSRVGTPKSLERRSHSLKAFSYSFRRYVFKTTNGFSKTSGNVSTY